MWNRSGYALGLALFALFENFNVCALTPNCSRNHHFRITVKVFFIWQTLFKWLLLKVLVFCMLLHNWESGIFPPHGLHLSASLISARAGVTKCDFKLLLFLKPIIGTSGYTFYDLHLKERLHTFKWLSRCLNNGYTLSMYPGWIHPGKFPGEDLLGKITPRRKMFGSFTSPTILHNLFHPGKNTVSLMVPSEFLGFTRWVLILPLWYYWYSLVCDNISLESQ